MDKLKYEAEAELVSGQVLSPQAIRQITDASEVLTRTMRQYDFSSIIRSMSAAAVSQELVAMSERVTESLIIPTKTLAAIQKSLVVYSAIGSQLAALSNITLAVSSMFAEIQLSHQRIFRSLTIDLTTIAVARTSLIPNQSVILSDYTVTEQDGHLVASGQAIQTKQIGEYAIIHKADVDLIFTELEANRSELREIKRLLTAPGNNEPSRVEYADVKFRREASHLLIHGFEIQVQRSSAQARFCDLFFSSPENFKKKWDIADALSVFDGFHIGTDGTEEEALSKIKGYVHALNLKIKAGTAGRFSQFFILLDLEVYINPDYLAAL